MKNEKGIGLIVKTLIDSVKNKRKELEEKVNAAWNEVLTEKERENLKIISLLNTKMVVKVSSTVWLYEIMIGRKEDILKRMLEKLGKSVISDIRYTI